MEPVETIRYEPGPPAPGRLALVQTFVNTVDLEHHGEMLHSPEALRVVLADLGLLSRRAPVDLRDLEAALDLRDAIRALALANNGIPTDLRLAADLRVHVDESEARLEPLHHDVEGALAELVGIVYTARADGSWSRLKACRRDVCHWLFYDNSRNQSGIWCSMAVCGNRTKTRAYRARRT
jgi:predicted RNA-binding Zn ribbon-like protein